MKRYFHIYLILIFFTTDAIFADYGKYMKICRTLVYCSIRDQGPFYSPNVRRNINEVVGMFTHNSIICLKVTIAIDRKSDHIKFLKDILKQKVLFEEITEKEMKRRLVEEAKKIPDAVKLFDKSVHFSKFLKIYCIYPNGEKKEISNNFELRYLSNTTIESKKGKNMLNIMLFFKKGFIMSLKSGLYKIEVIYDSLDSKVDTVWKGKIKKDPFFNSKINLNIIRPRNQIQYLAGELNWVYFCCIYPNIFSKKEIDEIITLGKRILTKEPGFYMYHFYLGQINYRAYKRYNDEKYKKEACNEYKKWLKIFDNLHIQGALSDKEWEEYSHIFKIPIEKRLKELK